jgi:hypothetical protein
VILEGSRMSFQKNLCKIVYIIHDRKENNLDAN